MRAQCRGSKRCGKSEVSTRYEGGAGATDRMLEGSSRGLALGEAPVLGDTVGRRGDGSAGDGMVATAAKRTGGGKFSMGMLLLEVRSWRGMHWMMSGVLLGMGEMGWESLLMRRYSVGMKS